MDNIELIRFFVCFGVVVLGALFFKGVLILLGRAGWKVSKFLEMVFVIAIPAIAAAIVSDAWIKSIAGF